MTSNCCTVEVVVQSPPVQTVAVDVSSIPQVTVESAQRGPQGPAGPQGDIGPQGPQGPQGPAGASGTSDYNNLINKPTNVSTFNNDAGYITQEADTLASVTARGSTTTSDLTVGNIYPNADNTYFLGSPDNRWHTLYVGPGSLNIDGIRISNGGSSLVIHGPISFHGQSGTQTVPWTGSVEWSNVTSKPTFATVATSGNYTDLTNKPTFAAVATSGNYTDLTNKPTGLATESFVSAAINSLVNSAPGTLDTLGEISTALQNDSGIIASILSTLSSKIEHEDLSVSTGAATGGGQLTYDNANGSFVFYPANLSSYVTNSSLSSTLSSYVTNSSLSSSLSSYVTSSSLSSTLGSYVTNSSLSTSLQSYITTSGISVTSNTPFGSTSTLSYSNGVFTFTSAAAYSLPTASTTVLGGVKVDGTSITITDGVISATASGGGATTLAGLSDVNITDPNSIPSGYVLKWNGSKWAPGIDSTSGGGGVDADTLDGQHGGYYLDYTNFTNTPNLSNYITTSSLSVTTDTASSGGSLSYSNGVFTFRPADLSSFVTSSSLSSTLSSYVTSSALSSTLSSYATQSYVGSQGFITTSSLSITTNSASGSGSLSYSNGVFTFTPAASYVLPAATTTTLGGVIVPVTSTSGFTNSSGTIGLATASTSQLGGVKVDGSTITISSGIISTVYSQNQNLSTTSNVTFNNITTTGQILEKYNNYTSNISTSVTLDSSNGNIFYVNTGTVSANWQANITNLAVSTGYVTNVTIIISQGATPYIPNALTINGSSTVTINWQGGSTPSGNANKKDAVSFGVMQTGAGAYIVLGQLVSFG